MNRNLLSILVAAVVVAISVNALMQRGDGEGSSSPTVPPAQTGTAGN